MKMLTPSRAVLLARETLMRNGLMMLSKSASSYYFKSKDSNFKIRVSDHKTTTAQAADVAVNLVFDYETIETDVRVRCERAVSEYRSFARNKMKRAGLL